MYETKMEGIKQMMARTDIRHHAYPNRFIKLTWATIPIPGNYLENPQLLLSLKNEEVC